MTFPTITVHDILKRMKEGQEYTENGFSYYFEDQDILVSCIRLADQVPFAISGEPGDSVNESSHWVQV